MTDEPAEILLPILREIRKELAAQQTLVLQAGDYMRKMEQRLDARIVGVRDDLELMLKSEMMGRFTHFETTIEQRLEAIESRVAALEARA